MKKKLLLTYPNQRWQKEDTNTSWNLLPSTLCLLAEMVKNEVDVKIIDAHFYDLSEQQFRGAVSDYKPDYVGISVLTSEYGEILDIAANIVKDIDPSITVIAGGVYPTIDYMQVMQNESVDYCVIGEGEYVIRELIQHLNGKLEDLPSEGIVYRKNGEIVKTPRAFVSDLTKLPWPDYSLVKLEDYLTIKDRGGPVWAPERPLLRLIVTRGCPVGCSFCQVGFISGKKTRTRDPEDVVNELLFLKQQYGIKSVIFEDDNISMNKKFFMRLLELMIEKELNLKYMIQAFAIFTLNEMMLDLLVKAGCVGLNVAIESGNQRVMDEIVLKPLKLEKIPQLIKMIRDRDLFVIANFIIGFPGESWEEIRETIRFAEQCGADYCKFFVALPLSHTKMFDMAVAKGVLDTKNHVFVEWRYGQISSDEWTSKDISILRAYEWDRINFSTKAKRKRIAEIWSVTEEQVEDIRKKTRDAVNFEK